MKSATSRKTEVAVAVFVLGVVLAAPSVVHAQPDHLKCFKAKDSAKFNAEATLSALQTQFGVDESCQIKGKGKLFCVPVTKQVTAFEDKSKDGIPQASVAGQDLTDDRICYKIKCPKKTIGSEVVTDQFGTRTMEKFKAQFLCTPAAKGTVTTTMPPPTTTMPTTTTTTPPPDDPCQPKTTPGCSGCTCESEVCAQDPFCCGTAWEEICVRECEATGSVTCSASFCVDESAPTCGGDCSWAGPNADCTDTSNFGLPGICSSGTSCTTNDDCASEPFIQECFSCSCVCLTTCMVDGTCDICEDETSCPADCTGQTTCDAEADCESCVSCTQAPGGPCEEEANACSNNQDCVDFVNCAGACGSDPSCIDDCVTTYPTGAELWAVVSDCILVECPTTCGQ